MIPDWITALVAVAALALSGYNFYIQRRDRKPRLVLLAYWDYSIDYPMAGRGTADPGEAIYRCEITNVGLVGVTIKEVKLHPYEQARPLSLHLPPGETTRKLETGDAQMWLRTFYEVETPPDRPPITTTVRAVAYDTVGNTYPAVHSPPLSENFVAYPLPDEA